MTDEIESLKASWIECEQRALDLWLAYKAAREKAEAAKQKWVKANEKENH